MLKTGPESVPADFYRATGDLPAPHPIENRFRSAAAFLGIALLFCGIYLATGCYAPSPFKAHVYLAESLLHGRFDLINPPGYFEMVRYNGRSYIAYGIGPSILMLPFVAIWGLDFNQAIFMAGLAGLAVALWWSTLARLEIEGLRRALLTLLFALGSLFWFYGGASGNTWSLMHVTAVFGLMLAIHETVGKRRGWIVGLGFGTAVLSRQPVLLSLPFFAGMLWKSGTNSITPGLRREAWFAFSFGVLLLFDAYYNAARFGSPFDNGYRRVVMMTTDPRFLPWGIFSIRYIPENVRTYFLKLPENLSAFPWYNPTMGGFTIFLSTPALYLAFSADYRKPVNWLSLAACACIQALYITYYWSGYAQFGCRYTVDYLPFVSVLAADGSRHRRLRTIFLLTVAGMVVEIWGILWWHYKGW